MRTAATLGLQLCIVVTVWGWMSATAANPANPDRGGGPATDLAESKTMTRPTVLIPDPVATVVLPPTTTSTTSPPTTTAPPAKQRYPARRATTVQVDPAVQGLGTWLDIYDWTLTYTGGHPKVDPVNVDDMAAAGVQTLYLQAVSQDEPGALTEPNRLDAFIARAHARGVRVVLWYLPDLKDLNVDFTRLVAMANLPVEGIAVDIEDRSIADPADRSARLVNLSTALREAAPTAKITAVVMPPVVTDIINPNFWPAFPWRDLAPLYDTWMPMDYWNDRSPASGWRDPYRYTVVNVSRLRLDLGQPNASIHVVGGVGLASVDADGFVRGARDSGAVGASIYNWPNTDPAAWTTLGPLRVP